MKRIIISLLIIITCFSLASAQQDTAAAKQDGTVVVTEWEDTQESTTQSSPNKRKNFGRIAGLDFNLGDTINDGVGIAIISIILIFGLPFFVIFIAFYFKYKNRRAKYKLIEQALASGQPLPENFLKEVGNDTTTRNKGITNIFTGLGLFIFLWAITGEFSIGSIGLLVMCIRVGQAVIYYLHEPRNNKRNDNSSGY